ncbi:hypothetical protein CGRA01v4_07463 [Colletotrichum graminicola]|nr:hypothetical protein CGRA01v4_07463 [Colletotrichum graminicola]
MNLVVLTSPSQPTPRASKNRQTPSTGIDTHLEKCRATFSTRFPRASRSRQRLDAAPFPSPPHSRFSPRVPFIVHAFFPPRLAAPHSHPPFPIDLCRRTPSFHLGELDSTRPTCLRSDHAIALAASGPHRRLKAVRHEDDAPHFYRPLSLLAF